MANEIPEYNPRPECSPQRAFALAHAQAVREIAYTLFEASDALLTLLEENHEETIDITGALSRTQDQLNNLLGGDAERHLRAQMRVSKADLGLTQLTPIPQLEDDESEEAIVESTAEDDQFPDGITCEEIPLRKSRKSRAKKLSRRKLALKQLREYHAEQALIRKSQREKREIRDLMTANPFKTNSTRDDSVFITHGTRNHRAKK